MSVFGQQSQTLTEMAKQLGHSDHLLKAQYRGSAPMDNSITAESWLPGTTGAHCNVTHGDHSEVVKGDMTQHFHGNKDSTCHGDLTETHNGDVTRHMYAHTSENHYGTNSKSVAVFGMNDSFATYQQELGLDSFKCARWSTSVSWAASVSIAGLGAKLQANGLSVTAGYDVKFVSATLDLAAREFAAAGLESLVKGGKFHVAVKKDEITPLSNAIKYLQQDMKEVDLILGEFVLRAGPHVAPLHIPPSV